MNEPELEKILLKYKQGLCTAEEKEFLCHWVNEYAKMIGVPDIRPEKLDLIQSRASLKMCRQLRPLFRSNLWYKINVARAVIAVGLAMFHYYLRLLKLKIRRHLSWFRRCRQE